MYNKNTYKKVSGFYNNLLKGESGHSKFQDLPLETKNILIKKLAKKI